MQSERGDMSTSEGLQPFMSLPLEDVTPFWSHLFSSWRETLGFGCKSVFNRDIDFYGDLVERHLSLKSPALSWFDRDKLISVSYDQLASEVDALTELWLSNPIKKGDSICIICSHSYHRIVALLTAFRLGLVPLLLDPTGPVPVQAVLETFEFTHLQADPAIKDWIPETLHSKILRLNEKSSLRGLDNHCYPAKSVGLRLIDPFSGNTPSVIEITAQNLFLRLLRDSYSVLNLKTGSRLATSLSLKDSTSPIIELMTLLCGASLTYVDDRMSSSLSAYLLTEPFDLIGISKDMMESLLRAHEKTPKTAEWKRWYRSPLESKYIIEWQSFTEKLSLKATPHADLHWAAPCAGIAFGSEWSTDLFDFAVYPTPGETWFLGEMASPETPTKAQAGRLVILSEREDEDFALPTPFILSQDEKAYRFLGCYPSGRSGLAFPEDLIQKCLEAPLSWHTVIELPVAHGSQFVLLAFMDERTPSMIQKKIEEDIGEFALPDQIETIPYVPKLSDKGEMDREWAKRLYMSGEFTRRRKIPVYSSLTKLKLLSLRKS